MNILNVKTATQVSEGRTSLAPIYKDGSFPLWVSDSKKRANENQLARDLMDYYDMVKPIADERVMRMDENYQLHSGRWEAIQNINSGITLSLGNENVVLGSGKLNHFPIVDRVSKSVVSDFILKPLIPVIRDISSKARNHRERVRLERVQAFFQNTIIQPALQEITMQYDQENQVTDVLNLTIEEQQQRQADIERRLQENVPEEIFDAMDRLHTPDEMVAEILLKEGLRYVNMKSLFDIGAENAVVTAEEYYRLGLINGMPHAEALNPKWVTWGGSEHVTRVEKGQYARYSQYLTPEDGITKYSHHLLGKDIKKIASLYSELPSYLGNDRGMQKSMNGIERRVVDLFADNPELQNDVNIRTREGQQKLRAIYSSLEQNRNSGFGVKETYITWRWLREVSFVTRMINGKLETFIRAGHYQKDPFAGDIDVVKKAIPQVWHGVKLGEEFYIDVAPVPYQYTNINDPFDVNLSIFGGTYNTFQNNVRNASLIDLGKPWQYKYNVLMKKMEEHQATDIGKVFLGTVGMIPKGWTWAQWYKSLFLARTAIVSTNREGGINPMDAQLFRSIDLSRNNDIANDLQQLEYFENKIVSSMYYSSQKLGDVSQYATNQNTQIAVQGVDRQMYTFHNKNREIKESVLNAFLHICLHAYKDNEEVKATVLDDFLKAHYEQNFNRTDSSNFQLSVVDDFRESEKLQQMRQLALTFLQNGMTPTQLSRLMKAESMNELHDLLQDLDKQAQKAMEQSHQREMEIIEEQRKAAQAQLELQQAFVAQENEREREVKLRMSENNSLLMANANDINNNKINDSIEKALLDLDSKERLETNRLRQELEIKEKELKQERELAEKELKSREKISRKST